MNTIEPRLIALLNTELYGSYPPSPSLELPPLHDPNILKASGRPLVLEPDASKRSGNPQHASLVASVEEEGSINGSKSGNKKLERALGNSFPQSLRNILDDDTRNAPSPSSKKRSIVESSKDDFVQLPQPPKKHKAAKQVVPPIIIGLFEPPPQTAVFPPIASGSFRDRHGRNSLNTAPLKIKEVEEKSNRENVTTVIERKKAAIKGKPKKDVAPRKKWSEEETNNLLLGVAKHGIGCWRDITEDPSFSFNDRSASDLKDRFRTCCPAELRGKGSKSSPSLNQTEGAGKQSRSSLLSENILIVEDKMSDMGSTNENSRSSRKSKAHRRKLEDLAQLGINRPFWTPERKERRQYSTEEDAKILRGYEIYGPAWSRIQRDPQLRLESRRARDLRDRFRTMFPEKFRQEDVASAHSPKTDQPEKESPVAAALPSSTLQPSSSREGLRIHHIISENDDTTFKTNITQPQVSSLNFTPYSDQPAEFDWNSSGTMGEMDIARLLLDETWMENANGKERQSFTEINSILSSDADGLNHVSSYYDDMLLNNDSINMNSSVTLDHNSSFS